MGVLPSNCCQAWRSGEGFGIRHLPPSVNSHLRAISTGCEYYDDDDDDDDTRDMAVK